MNYYNWNDTLGYNAPVTCVITLRGKGKTYGLRKQFIKDYLKDGSRFVEVCRYKDEIDDVFNDYFDKLIYNKEKVVDGLIFKYTKKAVYVAKEPENKKDKIDWNVIGYFCALSQMQRTKKRTYVDVNRIVYDEAILDYSDRYHRYLNNEFALLSNVVDSCTREHPDGTKKREPHVYLLANAVDLVNPIFIRYGIVDEPNYGKNWYANKTFLLDYVEPKDDSKQKLEYTLAGKMVNGTDEADAIAKNKFKNASLDFIAKKTAKAVFSFGVKYKKNNFGVWIDDNEGYFYVNNKIPKNTNKPIYALTKEDSTPNLIVARKSEYALQSFVDLYYEGVVRYENINIKNNFLDALSLFGVR